MPKSSLNGANQPRTALYVTLTALALGACARSEAPPVQVVTQDSNGVAITPVPASLAQHTAQWQTSPRPILTLGEPLPGSPSQYYRISGVRLLPGGRVMFSTDASKQLLTVDSTGATVEARGRMGRGPFEFQHLQMLKSADTSVVALFDALQRQVTVLPIDAFEPTAISLAALGVGATVPLARFADGSLLARREGQFPAPAEEGVVRGVDTLVRMDTAGRIVARYGAHPADERVLRLNASGGLTGGRPPYRRQLLADADDSTVVVAASGRWELWLYPVDGGTPRQVRLDLPRRAVNAAMRRQYRERVLRDVRDEYGKREWTMLSGDDVFPRELPAFDQLLIDRDGAIWVRETVTLADTEAQWIVLDRSGLPLARVRLPASFTAFDVHHDRIAGVWVDSLGGEQVQVWALTRR